MKQAKLIIGQKRQFDPTYPARFREAMQVGIRVLEHEAVRRAYDGERKLVAYKGKPVRDIDGKFLYETERSHNLIIHRTQGTGKAL